MLVPSMNNDEVTREVIRDRRKIDQRYMHRLAEQYCRERKRMKINNRSTWSKDYTITTPSKNTWIVIIQKAPYKPKYKGIGDVVCCAVTYYYPERGLRVFRPAAGGEHIEVFNGHFFTRYNERMKLNLPYQADVIKRFFHTSGFLHHVRQSEDNVMSTCKDGIAFGNWYEFEKKWLLYKTFVSHDMKHEYQAKRERAVQEGTQKILSGLISMSDRMEEIQNYKAAQRLLQHISARAS